MLYSMQQASIMQEGPCMKLGVRVNVLQSAGFRRQLQGRSGTLEGSVSSSFAISEPSPTPGKRTALRGDTRPLWAGGIFEQPTLGSSGAASTGPPPPSTEAAPEDVGWASPLSPPRDQVCGRSLSQQARLEEQLLGRLEQQ